MKVLDLRTGEVLDNTIVRTYLERSYSGIPNSNLVLETNLGFKFILTKREVDCMTTELSFLDKFSKEAEEALEKANQPLEWPEVIED